MVHWHKEKTFCNCLTTRIDKKWNDMWTWQTVPGLLIWAVNAENSRF
jgi:hypothetical protein